MDKEIWHEHECDPLGGEWNLSEDVKPTFGVPERPATVKLGTKEFPVHYLEFKNTILQIDTESNDIICIWERMQ